MNDLRHRGHTVIERGLGEGIVQYVVAEHSDGLVGGRGAHGSAISARAEVDECADGLRAYLCSLRMTRRIDELAADRAQVRWR